MSGADPIPAIREEDAEGEIAEIFADLRVTLGVPFVNLIWRNLATIPGGLGWTWALVKPLYVSGELDARSDEVRGGFALPDLKPVPDFAWDSTGLARADRRAIASLIGAYNHANGVNFLALLVARSILRQGAPPTRMPASAASVPRPSAKAQTDVPPRLIGLSELTPPLLRLVRHLDGFGRLGASEAIGSLYRHLAHWPVFLAFVCIALEPLQRAGALADAQRLVITAGQSHVAALAPVAGEPSQPLGADARERVLSSIDEFTRLMIGRMIVMGGAMLSLLPAEDR